MQPVLNCQLAGAGLLGLLRGLDPICSDSSSQPSCIHFSSLLVDRAYRKLAVFLVVPCAATFSFKSCLNHGEVLLWLFYSCGHSSKVLYYKTQNTAVPTCLLKLCVQNQMVEMVVLLLTDSFLGVCFKSVDTRFLSSFLSCVY